MSQVWLRLGWGLQLGSGLSSGLVAHTVHMSCVVAVLAEVTQDGILRMTKAIKKLDRKRKEVRLSEITLLLVL